MTPDPSRDAPPASLAEPLRDAGALARLGTLVRADILKMLHKAGSGHTGGSLSAVDILVALFYGHLRLRPDQPAWPGRDRFVLSKGHGAPALYAVLMRVGILHPGELTTLRQLGSCLQGHPDCKLCSGVECSTGSLGQGLGIAVGMALGLRLDESPARVFALLGDGECQEGSIWEAAMSASHYGLGNLTAFVDNNGLQIDGRVSEVMEVEPLADKWRAFGWSVQSIDGHDYGQILAALDKAEAHQGGPSMIVARTVKGKGVSIFEDKAEYHGVAPDDRELALALAELGVEG